MSKRNQPYLPLYVQDFLTDEKLMECSAAATGIYIRLMCIMHKSEQYGKILLKQKDKQHDKQIKNFAAKLFKHLPYALDIIEYGLDELTSEGVLTIEGDYLIQKRMVKDNSISEIRSEAGKKGGIKSAEFAKAKNKANTQAKAEANTEYEYEDEIEGNNEGGTGEEKIKFAENVLMTKTEFKKLSEAHGGIIAKKAIDILDNYKGSKGKKYKSDYRAILSWVIDKIHKENGATKTRAEQFKETGAEVDEFIDSLVSGTNGR